MKKKLPMLCNIISAVLVIVFVIKCLIDYKQYLASWFRTFQCVDYGQCFVFSYPCSYRIWGRFHSKEKTVTKDCFKDHLNYSL